MTIYTIGHSNRTIEAFLALLCEHRIELLVDIRAFPKSRHNPQFAGDTLAASLPKEGIAYQHIGDLGGRRRKQPVSPNGGWRNASFQGYADYMQTGQFENALNQLIDLAREKTTVIMCAEAVPWRCHRSLVGDALLIRGITVLDIMAPHNVRPHTLTSFAHVDGTSITYPPESSD